MPGSLRGTSVPHVLVDATSIPPSHGGVARFINGLLLGLEQAGFVVDVVAKSSDIAALRTVAPSHNYLAAPAAIALRPVRLLWEQIGLPLLARRRRAAVIHSPHYTFPLLSRAATVVTLHDATFFSSADAHSRIKGFFFRRWIRWANARATRLVAVSEATAREVQRYVKHAQPDIAVAYLGVDSTVFSPPTSAAVAAVRERVGLGPDQPWIAFLGTIEPRKNVAALIAAHSSLRAQAPETPILVLSGARGWDEQADAILDEAASHPRAERDVLEAGYLPTELLSAFLGGSELLVYPSLGEGFGLPVLEGMSSGAAVMTTSRLSIPEVGGDSVAYSEPDQQALEAALRELLSDAPRRLKLAAAGLDRSRRFTWKACAEIYRGVFSDADRRSTHE